MPGKVNHSSLKMNFKKEKMNFSLGSTVVFDHYSARKCLIFFLIYINPQTLWKCTCFLGFIKLYLSSFFMWKMSFRPEYDESFPLYG